MKAQKMSKVLFFTTLATAAGLGGFRVGSRFSKQGASNNLWDASVILSAHYEVFIGDFIGLPLRNVHLTS